MALLPTSLVARMRARLADPLTRVEFPPPQPGVTRFGAFETRRVALGPAPEPPGPAASPVTVSGLRQAEERLGFAFPEDLRQLYTEVADGGFGPSGGLACLDAAVARYEAYRAVSPSRGGQPWPAHLLPFNLSEPGCDAYDLDSGAVVLWDEERLAEGDSDAIWRSSFRVEAESLAAYLRVWLERPTHPEREGDLLRSATLTHLRKTLPMLRAMTTAEREAIGVSGPDWEAQMCRAMGVELGDVGLT
ncbi:MAG: SMI1/KNR4 family protein [Proteobacteria bacterium]|nr:SMI1/KNR4 family protein [Pseudomonadota bacterium]